MHQLVYTHSAQFTIAVVGKCAILIVFCCVETQPIENVQPIEVVQPIENAQRQNILIVYTY